MSKADRDPIQRAQAILELVLAQMEPRVQALRAEERELATRIEAGKTRVEMLQEMEQMLKARRAELETELDGLSRRHGEMASAAAGLESERVRLEAQIARLGEQLADLAARRDRVQAEADAEERQAVERRQNLRQEIEQLALLAQDQRERLQRELADLQAQVSQARGLAANEEARTQIARQAADVAQERSEEARRQLEGLRAALRELQEMQEATGERVKSLQQHYEQLQRDGRPLLPFRPATAGLTKAYFADIKYGNKLANLDWTALNIYCSPESGTGLPMTKVLTEALRNYLPHSAYERAIVQIREALIEQAKPAEEIDRVPPTGAGAGGEQLRQDAEVTGDE